MYPGEETLVLDLLEPWQGAVDDIVGPALNRPPQAADLRRVEVVHVGVEPGVQAPLAIEDIRRNHRPGLQTGPLEHRREGDLLRREEETAVVANAVFGREAASKDARVRRKGQRRDRLGLLEQDALPGEPVEHGCPDFPGAVRAESIRARGVERDDDEIQLLAFDAPRKAAELCPGGRALGARSQKPNPARHE